MSKHNISCDICMDLMPLVKDGIASEDSRVAVEEHMAVCDNCKNMYQGINIPSSNLEDIFHKFVHKMRYGFVFILMFGISLGLGLTAGQEMFYNSILMPVIGVLGYVIFRWKASYLVPVLMFATDFLTWFIARIRGANELTIMDSLIWTLIYCIFVIIGVVIAGLIHWCIKSGNTKQKVTKIFGLVVACGMVIGVGAFANALVGNPVSTILANNTAKKYLSEQYGGTDYVLDAVGFNFKDTDYYAKIKSPSSVDTYFMLHIDMAGNLKSDSFEEQVANGNNTARRLSQEYRELADTILESDDFPYKSEDNICYGDLLIESVEWDREIENSHIIMMEDLKLDAIYNVGELGNNSGELSLHLEDENVSVEHAAEMLLNIKDCFEEKEIGVYCVDFMLRKPRPESGQREDVVVWIEDFLWEDIYEEGLEERIQAAHDDWQKQLDEREKYGEAAVVEMVMAADNSTPVVVVQPAQENPTTQEQESENE